MNIHATAAEKSIAQILKLEARAQELRMQLDRIETRWNGHQKAVRGTPEWAAHCEKTGCVEHYNFGDVLA